MFDVSLPMCPMQRWGNNNNNNEENTVCETREVAAGEGVNCRRIPAE